MRRLETYDWWPELVAVKDELSLRELADKFGVTPGAISAALKREGITREPAPPGPRSQRPTQAKAKPKKARAKAKAKAGLPPEKGDAKAQRRRFVRPDPERAKAGRGNAKRPGKPGARAGSKDERILQHWPLLGSVPDREVADKAGVSVRTLASFRARHDIPAYSGPRRSTKGRKRKSKIDPYKDLLGNVPDREIADKAGVSLNAVRNYRIKHGIAAAERKSTKKAKAPAKPRAAAAPTTGRQAWKATIRSNKASVERVVVAESLVAAAEAAARSKQGEVVSISWLGELL